ncbi:MAG: hypothetical protein NT069_28620, partial [Planctomycetota bacterium]|nr:hypothetical protein [Planctomycetota bacterium]
MPIPKNQHAAGRVSRGVRWAAVGILLVLGIPTERIVFGQNQPGSLDAVRRAQDLLKPSGPVAEESKPEAVPEEAKPDAAKSEEEKKKAEEEKKKAEAKPAAETAKPITRPDKPSTPADPKELQIRPDEEGRVRFNFHGQPWLGVLDWLAEISDMSLDWQELPGDFLNLKTQRSYTVREARDVINRHLLDRGFTLLRDGEVLTLVNTKKLDPSLIPRVRPEDLSERDPHEFVKVSFPLDWLMAETTIEELKPLMSPNGKLTSLKTTNRLEAIDAVVNLRDMQTLLREEQSNNGRKRLVKPFRLKHVRADEVKRQIEGLLGLTEDPISAAAHAMSESTGPEMMGQIQMLQQVQAQAAAANQAAAAQPGAKGPPKVHMVVNARENTLLVNASADHLATISEAIEVIDQPSDNPSLLQTMSRMRVYRLTSIDPEPIVKMLRELGGLEPTTRLQVDKKNRSLIVHGALADHVIVKQLIEKLDGSDRKFEVVRLRRLEADYVAGTIEFMMAGDDKGDDQQNYNPFVFYYGQGGGQSGAKQKKFRVDADTENNRLLLWANEIELQEVEKLLVKLGEIPAEGASASRRRVIESISPDEAAEFLKRLKRAWPGVSPNPLEVDVQDEVDEEAVDPPEPPAESPRRRQPARGATPAAGRRSGSVDRVGSNRGVPKAGSAPLGTEHRLVDLRDGNAKLIAVAQRDELQPEFADPPEDVAPPARAKTRKRAELPLEETEVDEFEDSPRRPTTRRRPSAPRPSDDPSPVRVFQGPDGRLV